MEVKEHELTSHLQELKKELESIKKEQPVSQVSKIQSFIVNV